MLEKLGIRDIYNLCKLYMLANKCAKMEEWRMASELAGMATVKLEATTRRANPGSEAHHRHASQDPRPP